MSSILLAAALSTLLLAQGGTPGGTTPKPAASPAATPVATVEPVTSALATPTDGFGPELKAWLDASKGQDPEAASRALMSLQRRRAERNLTNVDELAAAISGRAQVRAGEGAGAPAADEWTSAVSFAPDYPGLLGLKAAALGSTSEAVSALRLAWNHPLERGRLLSSLLLCLLVTGALFAVGFGFALLLRYAAIFSHDVAEGLPSALKSFSLFMAVLFIALPLAGFMGWGYLPFWWITLFFIFETRAEKMVSLVILVGLALSSLALPLITNQRAIDDDPTARPLHLVAIGGTSSEGEALVRERLQAEPENAEWSLLSGSLARRAGRFDEAAAALSPLATTDPRFANNAAALELNKGNFAGARPGFTQASETAPTAKDKATALYNLSLVQVNTLEFEEGKESRKKGDALDAATLARYDRLFSFDRDGSSLQAPPDIVPDPALILRNAIPSVRFTADNAVSRLTIVAVVFLLFIPGIMKFRGAQSFSKQCPKCGTTFCWLCQTRSTSQDVCSQCHHLFVVKRGIPPAARAAKSEEISRYTTTRALLHRIASLAAPGAGHISVGHFAFGFPVLLVWAISAGAVLTLHTLAPLLLAASPLGSTLKMGFAILAVLTYVAAQAVKPQVPVVAPQRRAAKEAA